MRVNLDKPVPVTVSFSTLASGAAFQFPESNKLWIKANRVTSDGFKAFMPKTGEYGHVEPNAMVIPRPDAVIQY